MRPHSMPGITMSAPKVARPITLSTPSGRIGRVPTTLREALSRYVMSYSMTEMRKWAVIASTAKQSPAAFGSSDGDCFVALLLAMTTNGLLRRQPRRFRRVEGGAQLRRRHRQIAQANAGGIE